MRLPDALRGRQVPSAAAVLLMAYGGPLSLEDVEAYLVDVRAGRAVPPQLLEEMKRRYARLGGRSPLLENTQAQAQALQQELGLPVHVGMRHWHPYIGEVVPTILQEGIEELAAICLAPHYSRMSTEAYFRALDEALPQDGRLRVHRVRSWATHPLFLDALAERLMATLSGLPEGHRPAVIFTAHSLPARILEEDDPYHQELMATVEGVLERTGELDWHWAYQSQGHSPEPWLGPPVEEVVEAIARAGQRQVVLAPIGFVSEHVEVLYDLDVEVRRQAEGLALSYARVPTLGDHPGLIRCLASLARQALTGAA